MSTREVHLLLDGAGVVLAGDEGRQVEGGEWKGIVVAMPPIGTRARARREPCQCLLAGRRPHTTSLAMRLS